MKSHSLRKFENVPPKSPIKPLLKGPGGMRRESVLPANCWERPTPTKMAYWLSPRPDPQAPRNLELLRRERGSILLLRAEVIGRNSMVKEGVLAYSHFHIVSCATVF
jgi:hypothetical protein